jgi:DNA-binding MarR family transcriptional regulator
MRPRTGLWCEAETGATGPLAVLYYSDAPIKPSAAATLLFQETQSITGILHRIEARGWVQRAPDPNDRRAVGITLTA